MRHAINALILCLCAALPGPLFAKPLTLKDIVRLSRVIVAVPSPVDDQIAYIRSVPRTLYQDDMGPAWQELHVVDHAGESRPYVTGHETVRAVTWSPDGRRLWFIAQRGDDKFDALYSMSLSGGEAQLRYSHSNAIQQIFPAPDGETIAFLATEAPPEKSEELATKGFNALVYEESIPATKLWTLDLTDLEAKAQPMELGGSVSGAEWSPDGSQIAIAWAPTPLVDDSLIGRDIKIVDASKRAVVAAMNHVGKLGAFSWSPTGDEIAYIGGEDINDPRDGRVYIAPSDGGERRELFPQLSGHAVDLEWVAERDLRVLALQGVWSSVTSVDPGRPNPIAAPFPGPIARSISVGKAEQPTVAIVDAPQHPPEVYLLDGSSETRRLTDSNPWLSNKTLAKQEAIQFAAQDGLMIEAIVVQPLNRKRRGAKPLIVSAHGGPESHFSNGWMSTYSQPAHVMAAKGYAVIYPNYRGSTGRGVEFSKLGQNDYAAGEFNDLVDAKREMVKRGLADEDRVGITGGSYGGYASMWAASALSEHFAASVAFVGISNQISKFGTGDIPREMFHVHSRRWPWEDWMWMLKRSPVYHADKVKTPLLILAGDKDPRVHPSQSLEMYRNVKLRSKAPVRLVFYPGEKHGNRNTAAQYDYALRFERWMDHFLLDESTTLPPYELNHASQLEAD